MEQNTSILLVEDDLTLREILKKMCEKEGWTVFEAGNGQEAFEQTKAHKPQVVLLDLLMPVLDGFGYLKLVRKENDEEVSKVPVIVLSNLYSNEDILEAERLIISAYFVKANVTLEQVILKVKEILQVNK